MPTNDASDPKFYRIAQAAKLCGLSVDTMRRLADRGDIPAVWRGSHRVFPVASTQAYARSSGTAKPAEEQTDALAFGMLREGRSDEDVVCALKIPLARVLALRAHRDGGAPLAKTAPEPEEPERETRSATERLREVSESLARERADRRRMIGG